MLFHTMAGAYVSCVCYRTVWPVHMYLACVVAPCGQCIRTWRVLSQRVASAYVPCQCIRLHLACVVAQCGHCIHTWRVLSYSAVSAYVPSVCCLTVLLVHSPRRVLSHGAVSAYVPGVCCLTVLLVHTYPACAVSQFC